MSFVGLLYDCQALDALLRFTERQVKIPQSGMRLVWGLQGAAFLENHDLKRKISAFSAIPLLNFVDNRSGSKANPGCT